MAPQRTARAIWLGRRRYEPVHELQRQLHEARGLGHVGDIVLLVEHEPVITLGRGAKDEHVLLASEALRRRGVDLVRTGRGGDVTYHGPGQLVCYPILDLRPDRCDVRRYVRSLAEAMILLAREHGVESGVVDGMVGVWADAAAPHSWAGSAWASTMAKIGAIGVRLSRWITMHGFALNVSTDLDAFAMIVPCGIRQHPVASIATLAGSAPSVAALALSAAPFLERALDYRIERVDDFSLWGAALSASALGLTNVAGATDGSSDGGRRDAGASANT
jgi:lipoyl(octanoyl) transferase